MQLFDFLDLFWRVLCRILFVQDLANTINDCLVSKRSIRSDSGCVPFAESVLDVVEYFGSIIIGDYIYVNPLYPRFPDIL